MLDLRSAAQRPFVRADEALETALLLLERGQLPTQRRGFLSQRLHLRLLFRQDVPTVFVAEWPMAEGAFGFRLGQSRLFRLKREAGLFQLAELLLQTALLAGRRLECLTGLVQRLGARLQLCDLRLGLLHLGGEIVGGEGAAEGGEFGPQGAEPTLQFGAGGGDGLLVATGLFLQASRLRPQALPLLADGGLLTGGLRFQAALLVAQRLGGRFDLGLEPRPLLQVAGDGLELLAPAALLGLGGAVALQPRGDLRFAAQGAAVGFHLDALGGHLLRRLAQAGLLLGAAALQFAQAAAQRLALLLQPVEEGELAFQHLAAAGGLLDAGFRLAERGFVPGAAVEFGADLLDALLRHLQLRLDLAQPRLGALQVAIPSLQAEDVGEEALPLGGAARGELVGVSLAQVGGVDEGLVVQAQVFEDGLLRGADGACVDGNPLAIDLLLEVEEGRGALALPLPLAEDAETPLVAVLVGHAEGVLDGGHHLAVGDEVIIAAGAGLAPDGPGDGVEQRRLARAVVADEDGEVQAAQVEIGLPVGKETGQSQVFRDHRNPSSFCLRGCSSRLPRGLTPASP